MASRTDPALRSAWRSLSGAGPEEGWRLIPIERIGACSLSAGRRFPDNAEAVLATFPGVRLPAGRVLPHGRGFEVSRTDLGDRDDGATTIAFVREQAGSLDLFEAMAEDVVALIRREATSGTGQLLEALLRRVAAWQDFMRRPGDARLSAEQEVGLYGELLTLEQIVAEGVPRIDVVRGWEGPLDGLQDFLIGTGAVEVKSSLSPVGFSARISSLEQLDDAARQPLYLAAQRIRQCADGTTLPALVGRMRSAMAGSGADGLFDIRLSQAGYRDEHADEYVRGFEPQDARFFLVDAAFPRLVPGIVPPAIRTAVYGLELDQLAAEPATLRSALSAMEMI